MGVMKAMPRLLAAVCGLLCLGAYYQVALRACTVENVPYVSKELSVVTSGTCDLEQYLGFSLRGNEEMYSGAAKNMYRSDTTTFYAMLVGVGVGYLIMSIHSSREVLNFYWIVMLLMSLMCAVTAGMYATDASENKEFLCPSHSINCWQNLTMDPRALVPLYCALLNLVGLILTLACEEGSVAVSQVAKVY